MGLRKRMLEAEPVIGGTIVYPPSFDCRNLATVSVCFISKLYKQSISRLLKFLELYVTSVYYKHASNAIKEIKATVKHFFSNFSILQSKNVGAKMTLRKN